jgi:restriction endonuclease S subunit
MTLGDLCEFKTNFPEADFWLIRKGDEKTVGKPVKEYSPENIGVKVLNKDMIIPDYLYYYFMHAQMNGAFINLAHGTLKLKNIRISDIKNIPIANK